MSITCTRAASKFAEMFASSFHISLRRLPPLPHFIHSRLPVELGIPIHLGSLFQCTNLTIGAKQYPNGISIACEPERLSTMLQVRKEKIFRPEMFARVFLFRRAFARREENFGREPPLAGKRDDLHCLSPDGFLMRQTKFRPHRISPTSASATASTSEVDLC